MSRLPVVGQDNDVWGDILNDFLSVSHNTDGTLKAAGTINSAVQNVNGHAGPTVSLSAGDVGAATDSSVVHKTGNESVGGVKTFVSSPVVPSPTGSTDAANKSYVDGVVAAGAADATTSSKGVVQLAGDLGGTAASPTVPGLAAKEPTVASGTTSQYYRGDKSWQTLDKSVVGLGNVDNTSDANKPVSSATQTALNGKVDTSRQVGTSNSLSGGGDLTTDRTLSLVNDSATPGNSKYYGTDGTGTKGFYGLPASGETNTASNVGTGGVGVYKQKTGVNLEFKNVKAGSSKVTITDDVANSDVAIDVVEANFSGIPESAVTNLTSDLSGKINSSEKGAANGVAQLDGSGKVNPGQLQTANISKVLPYSYLGTLSVATGTFRLYNDGSTTWTIAGVRASVGTAPAGASIIIDIKVNGTTIFTTQANRPTIAAASNTSGNVTNMDVTTVAAGNYLTVDIAQVGSTTAGSDLSVQVEVY